MNILYLHSHDTGRYIQPYGYSVPTPHLQQFAEEGVVFRQAHCASPSCSPSRAALLTGETPHQNGMLGLSHLGFSLYDYDKHLVRTLQRAGYSCALSGIQHEDGPFEDFSVTYASRIGYDARLDVADMHSIWDHAVAHLRAAEFLRNAPRKPFFLSVGLDETHRAFPEPASQADINYCRPPAPFPDTAWLRHDMASFIHSARIMDTKMGHVLHALRESGLEEDTLVIVTTDHGVPFPSMKCNLTDHGTGVMLMLRGPGGFSGGRVVDSMVTHMDLYPTICDLAGIDHPSWLLGKSLLPLVQGKADEIHDDIFTELTYHGSYEPMRAVRTPRWKYIRRFDERRAPVLMNTDESDVRSLWVKQGWNPRLFDTEQLYDLFFDPNEACNLAAHPSYQQPLAEMRQRLDRWMHSTEDPLLHGPVPLPPGMRQYARDATGYDHPLHEGPLNPVVGL